MWCVAAVGDVCICAFWAADTNTSVSNGMSLVFFLCNIVHCPYQTLLEVKVWVHIRSYFLVGLDNFAEIHIDKVVERVNVLFDKTLDFQEGGQQLPFVLIRAVLVS